MKKTRILAIILVIVVAAVTMSCASNEYASSSSNAGVAKYDYADEYEYGDDDGYDESNDIVEPDGAQYAMATESDEAPNVGGGSSSPALHGKKLIITSSITVESLDFDKGIADIKAFIEKNGGYIESSNISGNRLYSVDSPGSRYANFTARIPVSNRTVILDELKASFNVIDTSEYTNDITESYYDADAWLKSLEEQYKRLEELLEKAETFESVLQVETEMARVRQEINVYYTQVKNMDSQVDYSTVNIYLSEVVKLSPVEPDPKNFGERISRAFRNSWVDFVEILKSGVVMVIYLIPVIILIGIIAVVVIFVIRKRKKKGISKIDKTKEKTDPQDNSKV